MNPGCCGNQAAPGTGTLGAIPAWNVTPQDWAPLFPGFGGDMTTGNAQGLPAALPWWVWLLIAGGVGYLIARSERS